MLSTQQFMRETLHTWRPDKKVAPYHIRRDPAHFPWEQEAHTRYPEAYGEYIKSSTPTPKKFTLEVLELPEFIGKPLWRVGQHISQLPNRVLPGLDLWSQLLQNQSKAKKMLTPPVDDWRAYFFFGSLFRSASGRWSVPYAFWNRAEFARGGYWLDRGWDVDYRVVLLNLPVAD